MARKFASNWPTIRRKPSNISSTTQPLSHSQTRLSLSSNLPQNPSRPHHCRRPIKEPTIAGSLTFPRRRHPLRTAQRVHVLPVEEEQEGAVPPCLAAAAAPCRRRSSSGSQFRAPPPLSPDPRRRSPPPSLALSAPPYCRCSLPVLAQQQMLHLGRVTGKIIMSDTEEHLRRMEEMQRQMAAFYDPLRPGASATAGGSGTSTASPLPPRPPPPPPRQPDHNDDGDDDDYEDA
ncbi:hypothetical protein PIB30_008922 [Stylosanthes scabra]|uniref:Uncharacterized protein n=1 Tax=Stylosanthes scabra TaxID=79078 RepID=A0ABU6R5M8_9FABA|nr:hypothetical protein [Stylosanthes scabra]